MSIITLLTDFGIEDEYVGIMKGVILSINPSSTIVDITHKIAPQDIIDAAYRIKFSYKYFPENTVHLVIVDPGVGSARTILAAKIQGHYFLAPDNGILTPLLDDGGIDTLVFVENSEYFLESVSQTFHGRDIFAPVAAHISKGIEIMGLGRPADIKSLVRLSVEKPFIADNGELSGIIVSIDRFGNLITNIDCAILKKISCAACGLKKIKFIIGDRTVAGLSKSYNSVQLKTPLAIIGSRGYLEIAVNYGSARDFFNASKYDKIKARQL
ncbi:MAG: SAM-dependent chlorinase/fluorinase [Deltaproteobacteria bacterium]|nr:SAM-dependent chlorinase/fluorinase [Deltaproteobacteria bacterium]